MSSAELKRTVIEAAKAEGFEAVGFAPVETELRQEYFRRWLQEGKHGDMAWMERTVEKRCDTTQVLPEARTVMMLGLNYYQEHPENLGYQVARYALGSDYHKLILKKLKRLCTLLREQGGINKPYVDTGPVLEKPYAARAGLGWQGKHTNLIHPALGNWLFLGTILTSL